jgi:hypothetical protein
MLLRSIGLKVPIYRSKQKSSNVIKVLRNRDYVMRSGFAVKIITIILVAFTPILSQLISTDKFTTLFSLEVNDWVGARAAAMGNAYTAAVKDVSAIHWNPAALVNTDDLSFWVSAQYLTVDLSPSAFNGDAFFDWQVEQNSTVSLNYVGLVFRWSALEQNIRIGFGLNQQEIYPADEIHLLQSGDMVDYS